MNNEKDRLVECLRNVILRDSYWLTRNDQDMIILQLDEWNKLVDDIYKSKEVKQ